MTLGLTPPPANARPVDVLAVGENSHDLLAVLPAQPSAGAKMELLQLSHQPGGQVATAAAALATLGWRTAYIGRFGDDASGDEGLASLAAAGVNQAHAIRVQGARSRTAIILVEAATGERTVLWDQDARLAISPDDVPDQAIAAARIVLLDDFGEPAIDVARRARLMGARTVVDVERVRHGLGGLLSHIDVIIAAQGFPQAMTGVPDTGRALAALQAETGAAIVCVTLGEAGSLARADGREVRTPACRVQVLDTTGAGDLFRAGFIAAWLAASGSVDLEAVLRFANATAALGCRGLGARGHLPSTEDVEELLRRGPPSA